VKLNGKFFAEPCELGAQSLSQYSFAKKLQSQTVIREKQRKIYLYKKAALEMLVKLTPGVNFTKILQAKIPKVQKDSQIISVFLYLWYLPE